MKQPEPEKEIKRFDKCPACGSTERLAESLANKVKLRGFMRPEVESYVSSIYFVIKDPNRAQDAKVPIGTVLPAGTAYIDICANCGCLYAPRCDITGVKKSIRLSVPGSPGLKVGRN